MGTRPQHQKPRLEEVRWFGNVRVFHPGYDIILFSLPAFDSIPDTTTGRTANGVNLRLVLDGCYIIASNEEGFLATDLDGTERIPIDNTLLPPGKYFYHLNSAPGAGHKYPVVCEFAAWTPPPPEKRPAHWSRKDTLNAPYHNVTHLAASASDMSEAVKNQDQRCILTQYSLSIGNARLIPKDEMEWFDEHFMAQYNIPSTKNAGINDTSNGVALRDDVRSCFDRYAFVFYPVDATDWMVYFILGEVDYTELLHRRLLVLPTRVAEAYVYARFALAIIHRVLPHWRTICAVAVPPRISLARAKRLRLTRCKKTPSDLSAATEASDSSTPNESPDEHSQEDGFSTRANRNRRGLTRRDASRHHRGTTSLHSTSEVNLEAQDQKWKDVWMQRFPAFTEEVENPPDSGMIYSHTETPRMRRLIQDYMEKNPQVQQTSGIVVA